MNVVWRTEWTKAYETPWSIFEKLSFANIVERNDILRILGCNEVKKIKSQIIGDSRRELISLNGFDRDLLHDVLGINLIGCNKDAISSLLAPIYYYRERRDRWFKQYLRWCNECIRIGYHSWLHQFILVEKCPYHDVDLIDLCPDCAREIPFLLSNKRLSSPFTCKCGYKLANFSESLWRVWDRELTINTPSTKKWISTDWVDSQRSCRWFFLPNHATLELLTKERPKLISCCQEKQTEGEDFHRSKEFRESIFHENKSSYKDIDRYIRKKLLRKHKECINVLLHLKKEEDQEFPRICPYAYAYVFWRKSLLGLDHFYNRSRSDEIDSPKIYGYEMATKLYIEELRYLRDRYFEHTTLKPEFRIHRIKWILKRGTAHLSLRYLYQWFKLAEGAEQIIVPGWKEIYEMKERSFPIIAFKEIEERGTSRIEFYAQDTKDMDDLPVFKCPFDSQSKRAAARKWKSYTPLSVAMKVFEYQSEHYKELQKYVDGYIRKLAF